MSDDKIPDPFQQSEQYAAEMATHLGTMHREFIAKGLSRGLADSLVRDWHWGKLMMDFGLGGTKRPGGTDNG